jgi:hypothetical protein
MSLLFCVVPRKAKTADRGPEWVGSCHGHDTEGTITGRWYFSASLPQNFMSR